jgi:pantothenate synthetase
MPSKGRARAAKGSTRRGFSPLFPALRQRMAPALATSSRNQSQCHIHLQEEEDDNAQACEHAFKQSITEKTTRRKEKRAQYISDLSMKKPK